MNNKIAIIALLFLMCLQIVLMPLEAVFGQNQNSAVIISQVTPSSLNGLVGTPVFLEGSISSLNGTFQIIFDQNVVAIGTSIGYYVAAHFNVPEISSGSYGLTLRDLSANLSSTKQFQVATGYSITPIPLQIQERGNITVNITLTGGQPNAVYNANVSVTLPSPLNTVYSKIVSIGTSNQRGTASTQVTYPDSSFQPDGSLTDYAGSYFVYFNQSTFLAQNKFSVGFLDSTTYHRGQTVTIKAVGYQPSQTAILAIKSVVTGAALDSKSLTASTEGIFTASWVVSSNTAIGDYSVQITASGIQKPIIDIETFSVLGYSVQFKTENLAGEAVPLIKVQALDVATNSVYNSASGSDGLLTLNLEGGVHSLTSFWSNVNVGQTNVMITGAGNFTLQTSLTDLKILVQNENGIRIPFVNLDISFQYQPASGGTSQIAGISGKTDLLGMYTVNSTLTGISYDINASIYNQIFNANNSTLKNVPAQAFSQVAITCPNEALTINVVGYNQVAIPSARIELVEITNSLFYTATTGSSGEATSQVTFGMYRMRVYKDNILINETNIEAFGEGQKQIRCTLYGIKVSVSVVDFLSQPIQNANVTLIGPATERYSATTKGNGTAIFNNIIGGNMQIVAFAQGAPSDYQAVTISVNQPTSVQIKLDKYIVLGPFLIQATTFITISIIFFAIILFAAVEIYRRRSVKTSLLIESTLQFIL